ncbi:MAG: hypothetical protein AUK09_02040 [Parcubacteria group bacterium CG2_30_36_38]|nr:GNAT family N-acetyltransferase [Candidatus Kuenenbacteria bacterium]OIP76416.1 MAG: hypothetical protein AUK09_02040 [Parcubacteria group bacterium CG2_30_36_38]
MEIKIFKSKKIKIRELSRKDLKLASKFQEFDNFLIEEGVQFFLNRKQSLKEIKDLLKDSLNNIRKKQHIFLVAEDINQIIGIADIILRPGWTNHVGELGISVRRGYRGEGIGTYLLKKLINLSQRKLRPKPEIIRLSVFPTNKLAINLYKKFGFKRVCKIPNQIKFKNKILDEIIMLLNLKRSEK